MLVDVTARSKGVNDAGETATKSAEEKKTIDGVDRRTSFVVFTSDTQRREHCQMSRADERMALSSLRDMKEDCRSTMPDKSPERTTITKTLLPDQRARRDFDHANDVVDETVSSMFTTQLQRRDFSSIFIRSMRFRHVLMMFNRFEQIYAEKERENDSKRRKNVSSHETIRR